MTDDTLTLIGWTLIAIAIGTGIILALTWKRPRTRELLALPHPTPAVQDAIDDGDDFDTHVDHALAIANPSRPSVPHARRVRPLRRARPVLPRRCRARRAPARPHARGR